MNMRLRSCCFITLWAILSKSGSDQFRDAKIYPLIRTIGVLLIEGRSFYGRTLSLFAAKCAMCQPADEHLLQ